MRTKRKSFGNPAWVWICRVLYCKRNSNIKKLFKKEIVMSTLGNTQPTKISDVVFGWPMYKVCPISFATTLLKYSTSSAISMKFGISINPLLSICQVSTRTVHGELHVRDVTWLVCFVRVVNRNRKKQLNNLRWFVFPGKPVLMPQKHYWNDSKSLWWVCCTLCCSVSLVQCVFRRARVNLWRVEKWKTDDDKNTRKHCCAADILKKDFLVFA